MTKAKKAALLSAIFMGLGQFSNKKILKGVLFAGIEIGILIFCIPYFEYSIWGLITLGETPQQIVDGIAYGDHSIRLLMNGFLAIIIMLLLILMYVMNIMDAYRTVKTIEAGREKHLNKSILSRLDRMFPVFMLTPAFIVCIFLVVFPVVCSFAIAFTNYSSPYHIPPRTLVDWVGFQNFKNLVTLDIWSNTFFGVMGWTVVWGLTCTFLTYFGGLFLAIITNSKELKLAKFWRSILILPMAMPGFISILIFRLAFNGLGPINQLLSKLGCERIGWLTDPSISKIVLIAVNLWLSCAGTMVYMSGILTGISPDLYEAASIDGASEPQKFRKVTLPLVLYSTAPILVMNLAGSFNNFGVIYLLTGGGPANSQYQYAGSTDILLSWIYKMTMDVSQYSMATTVSILIFIVVAIISVFNLRRTRSFKEEDLIQ